MKAEIVYNTEEKPRLLLTLECPEDELRMKDQPNLQLLTIETSVHGPTTMAFDIVETKAFERSEHYFEGAVPPLSMAEMKNPAHAMPGKSEADYQKFIMRYEATVNEALDAVLDSRRNHQALRECHEEKNKQLDFAYHQLWGFIDGTTGNLHHGDVLERAKESIPPCRDNRYKARGLEKISELFYGERDREPADVVSYAQREFREHRQAKADLLLLRTECAADTIKKLRARVAQLEIFEPPKCPTCEVYADNVGTEVTDAVWWCNGCDKDISQ